MRTEIRCAHCGGFIGLTESTQPLPSIYHAPCLRREQAASEPCPFMTPLDDPRIKKAIDETTALWERPQKQMKGPT